jgi:hypothetical protein
MRKGEKFVALRALHYIFTSFDQRQTRSAAPGPERLITYCFHLCLSLSFISISLNQHIQSPGLQHSYLPGTWGL